MSISKKLDRVYKSAKRIALDDASRIIIMSDCHRGDGSGADGYCKNQNIAYHALSHYYREGFTYIELGDGDELWANRRFASITGAHGNTFELLRRFYVASRLYLLYGNHDMVKRGKRWVDANMAAFMRKNKRLPLFPNVPMHEGLVLTYKGRDMLLLHGHQADFLNDELWRVARFLVRYLWRPLELIGIRDPGNAQGSHEKKLKIEWALGDWASKKRTALIAGHTHRPMFAEEGEPPYFNDGCMVHPRCITALEIEQGTITLVKWSVKAHMDGALYISRSALAGPRRLPLA
ncbi:MAG: metallophosphoesterase family protein [Christensenellaceae bacterium]|jgi:UDP-2,3-diacylglucosamine pyrophosphatase LpxH|nr:metallophosphoesterase family protein [Christensenellaceae bacterium]